MRQMVFLVLGTVATGMEDPDLRQVLLRACSHEGIQLEPLRRVQRTKYLTLLWT